MAALAEAPRIDKHVATGDLVRTWIILLPLLYFSNSGFAGSGDGGAGAVTSVHQAELLVTLLIASVFIFKRLTVIFAASLKSKLIMAWPVLALVSCLWSDDPRQSLVSATTLFCFTLFAIYFAETYDLRGQFDVLMITGVVAVLLSIFLAVAVPSIGISPTGWRGMFAHKQQCAAAVTLFLITALHWKPNRPFQAQLRFVFILLCIFLIIMSASRTGWLLSLIAVALTTALRYLQRFTAKDAFFLLFTAVPLTAGLVYLIKVLSALILTSIGKDPTLSDRTVIWAAVWVAIQQHPWLGYGYEAFWRGLEGSSKDVVIQSGWDISQAQSGYLDLWLQFGISGLILIVLTTAQGLKHAIANFRRKSNANYVRWAIVVILCNLFYNIGESDFGYLRIGWFLFVIACIGLQQETADAKEEALQPQHVVEEIPRTRRLAS